MVVRGQTCSTPGDHRHLSFYAEEDFRVGRTVIHSEIWDEGGRLDKVLSFINSKMGPRLRTSQHATSNFS